MHDSPKRFAIFIFRYYSRIVVWVGLLFLAMLSGNFAGAQGISDFWARYLARASATQAEQPHWPTPLFSSTARLEQGVRADFLRQTNATGVTAWNLGNSRGFQLIPLRRVELRLNVPPYVLHEATNDEDGFGDVSFQIKYRFYARNEQHGNAIVTAIVAATVPTGKSGNGQCCATVTPSLAAGKGFGQWSFLAQAGVSLPVTNARGLGRTITWNNTAQYRLGKTGVARLFTPEVEVNSSFFRGGASDGKTTVFATPGILVGRISLTHDASGKPGRLGLTVGAGEQIALTAFHKTNHNLLLATRLRF